VFKGTAQDSGRKLEEYFAGDKIDRRHKAFNILNAIINSLFRVAKGGSFTVGGFMQGGTYNVFNASDDDKKKFEKLKNELIRIRTDFSATIPKRDEYPLNTIDSSERNLNSRIGSISEYSDGIASLFNFIIGLTSNDLSSAKLNAELNRLKLDLALIRDPSAKFSDEIKNKLDAAVSQAEIPGTLDKPNIGQPFKEPSSWKEKRMPDAAPDIFGATVSGSKATINSGVDKLNNTDDSQFLNIYQGEIETIENAFIANEGKLSGQEKAKYQREMKSLEDRYYTLLYKDKEKPFVD
jgi:major membrane immunogen (membrane-anchored lipoprotein)